VVNGRLLTTPAMVDGANPGAIPRPQLNQATLQVLDALVAQSRK
jgi:thiol:disulfide interchange protein DsbA